VHEREPQLSFHDVQAAAIPTVDDIRAAAGRIAHAVFHTPLVKSHWLSEETGADIWLKLEFVQPTGSFKVRGAINAMQLLKDADAQLRVVTASAGNHGLAVAFAGGLLNVPVRVYLPASAPAAKREGIGRLGAEVLPTERYEAAEARAQAEASTTGATYLSPYSHPYVIAGAGTVALEMLADQPTLDVLVAPIGGGGLLSGCAIASQAPSLKPQALEVIGAEAEASPVFTSSLAAGRIVQVDVTPTLADGLAGNMERDSVTFDIVRRSGARVTIVSDEHIREAMRGLLRHEHLIVEGAAATAVGALRHHAAEFAGRRIGVILTGRNVDADVIQALF
jgi:threonine dehydratase